MHTNVTGRRSCGWLRAASIAASALATLCPPHTAGAQSYPTKPIRLIVPYTAGGDTDVVARLIAPKLAAALGQQVLVENRPGAGSLIGTQAMLAAPADGHTIAMGTISSLAVLPVTRTKVPYDPLRDIAPIVLATRVPYVLHVHPSVPARSVAELVKLGRARPGQLTYGTPGIATGIHLTTEYFSNVAGVKLVHVPYKGSSVMVVDLIAGNIVCAFTTFATTRQHLKAQRLRALAIAAAERSEEFPQIPTMSEAGFAGFQASTWHGVVARADTPAAIVSRLNTEIAAILKSDEVSKVLVNAGFEVGAGSAEDFARFVRSEIDKWRKVASFANLRLD